MEKQTQSQAGPQPELCASEDQPAQRYPSPPPSVRGLFLPLGEPILQPMHRSVWAALRMYMDSVEILGKLHPGWETFERELASQFALLLRLLAALPREAPRRHLLDLFLEGLNLENKRGRSRKAKQKLSDIVRGQQMASLWDHELQEAWNMKESLARQRISPRARLVKGFHEDTVQAVLSPKATPESSVARVYAQRHHVSVGRARNALRKYQKWSGTKFAPQI